MRTRAQQARDAALRRLTRTNRSLTAAALVGTAALVEVIAQSPLGHAATRTTERRAGRVVPEVVSTPARTNPAVKRHAPVTHKLRATSAPRATVSSSDQTTHTTSSATVTPSSSQTVTPAASSSSQTVTPAASSSSQTVTQQQPVVSQPTVVVSGGS